MSSLLILGEDGEVTANHLFLAIWSDKESAGHKVLASLGFDDEKASLLAKTVMFYFLCRGRYLSHRGQGFSILVLTICRLVMRQQRVLDSKESN